MFVSIAPEGPEPPLDIECIARLEELFRDF